MSWSHAALILVPTAVAVTTLGASPAHLSVPDRLQDEGDAPAAEAALPDDVHAAWRARLAEDGRAVRLENVEGNTCLACHQTVGEEWRHSTHATAWQDEHYQKELKSIRRKKGCWGCHAPVDLLGQAGGGTPATRPTHRHLGVTCTTCHTGPDGAMLGPKGIANDAHASVEHHLFDAEASSDLCLSCHDTTIGPVIGVAKDFTGTELQDFGESCVGCHMPAVRRAWAEDPDTGEPTPIRLGRSHRLQTPRDPEFLATSFDLRVEVHPEGAVLTVANATGHRVPGLVERKLTLKLELLAEDGAVRGEAEHTFDHRAYLPVEEEHRIEVEGTRGVRVRVVGLHEAPGMRRPQEFLDRELTP